MDIIVQANQLFQQNQIPQAEQLYRQLLRDNPSNIDALWGLGKVALALDSYQPSYDIFSKCVQLYPNVAPLWLSLAQSCQRLHRYQEAEQALLKAYKINCAYSPSVEALAIFYSQSNNLLNAKKYLEELRAIEPDNVRAFCLMVRIKVQQQFDEKANKLLTELRKKNSRFNVQEQILLHYAFANLFQQSKDYKPAFTHYTQANRLQSVNSAFSVADMENYFNALQETFSDSLLGQLISSQSQSNQTAEQPKLTPIFIVGQPRSGSTLLEQMLINHSEIDSAGELPFLAGDIAQGIYQLTGHDFPKGCQYLTQAQCQSLGQHYLMNMQAIAPNAKFVIDKMPANYQSIGLIKMILPHAKVIHISRNEKAVSWSIFSNHFEAPEPYFCSLSEIEIYHQKYKQVMLHWQTVLPDFIHHLQYESLVETPKESLTSLLKFCSLSYQDVCLEFSQEKRYIDTLSDVQLRGGLHSEINKTWQHYKTWLPEFFNR